MAKNKIADYLPLKWTKSFSEPMYKIFGENFDPGIIRELLSENTTEDDRTKILRKYPKLSEMIEYTDPGIVAAQGKEIAATESIRDMDSISLVMLWALNKQVYKFNKDFTDELIRTDNVQLTKNIFDYLPYKIIYVDIEDNEELCKALDAKGMFISVEKISKHWQEERLKDRKDIDNVLIKNDRWSIHICKVNNELFFNDILFFPDTDIILESDDLGDEYLAPIFTNEGYIETRSYNAALYKKLVLQILLYLSSAEPDINESEKSKETYKAPSVLLKRPKNKYSEIRTWDVGIRYGTAFRKWKSEVSHNGTATGTGTKKRPHTRRAHWSYYWYGKKNSSERVRRAKWIAEMLIGVDRANTKEQPVVIHKAEQ